MTWETRDLPVLRAIVELSDGGMRAIMPSAIADRTGLDQTAVARALRALADEHPPFFQASEVDTGEVVYVVFPTGHARRTVGTWPTPEVWAERLIKALNDAADAEPDPERKGKLRRAAEAVASLGGQVLGGVITAYITHATGVT